MWCDVKWYDSWSIFGMFTHAFIDFDPAQRVTTRSSLGCQGAGAEDSVACISSIAKFLLTLDSWSHWEPAALKRPTVVPKGHWHWHCPNCHTCLKDMCRHDCFIYIWVWFYFWNVNFLQLSIRPFFNPAEILSVMLVPLGVFFWRGLSAKDVPES